MPTDEQQALTSDCHWSSKWSGGKSVSFAVDVISTLMFSRGHPTCNFNKHLFSFSPQFAHVAQKLQQPWRVSPGQGSQTFSQQTASTQEWYFHKALPGHHVPSTVNLDMTSFHTAKKTNTCKQAKTNRSVWAKTTSLSPRITAGWIAELHHDSIWQNQTNGFLHTFSS